MTSTYMHRRHPARTLSRPSGMLTRPVVAIGLAVAAATGFIVHALWPRWPDPRIGPDAPALPITVSGTAFNVPPAAVRVRLQRQPGAHDRVDLVFLWPSLAPPDIPSSPAEPAKGAPRPQPFERIFVTILAARDGLHPEERAKSIYPRFTEADPVDGPDGLTVLPFRSGTPYQNEDLIFGTGTTPGHFLVRCSRNGAGPTPGICMHVRRIDNADITSRFPRDWLGDWRTVAAGIEKLIGSLRPVAR